jgi:hypothetical protein
MQIGHQIAKITNLKINRLKLEVETNKWISKLGLN